MINNRHLLGSVLCCNVIRSLVFNMLTASVKVKIKVVSLSDKISVLAAKK